MSPLSPQDLLNLGLFAQLGAVFIAGILTSFTPCVYPLIPITLSLFGAKGETSRWRAFALSTFYVVGICTTYTLLGLLAAFTGSFFGSFLSNPWISLAIGVVLIFFGLAGLDIVKLRFSQSIQKSVNEVGGRGFGGAFTLGLVSGIIAAPCTGPILASILVIVGASGKPLLGSLLLFVHALGLGLIFLILGTFSGLLNKLPRSGKWLLTIKFLTSSAILIVALFFLVPALRAINLVLIDYYHVITVAAALVLAVALGLIAMGQDIRSLKVLAASCLAFTVFGLPQFLNRAAEDLSVVAQRKEPPAPKLESEKAMPAANETTVDQTAAPTPTIVETNASAEPSSELIWQDSLDKAFREAKTSGKIVMVDLYADWCAACKEYDRITFKDPKVIELLKKIVLARLDFTLPNDTADAVQKGYSVVGLPTILFLKHDGQEIADSRITGFYHPEEFIEQVSKLLK